MTNHYLKLGVKDFSNPETIKKQYRKLAKIYHPDKNPDNPTALHKFQVIASAYEFLNDPQKKESLDNFLQGKRSRNVSTKSHAERTAEARRKREALKRHEIESRYFKYASSWFTPLRRMYIAIFALSILCGFFVMNYFQNYQDRSMVVILAFCALSFAAFIYLLVDAYYINYAFSAIKKNITVERAIRKSGYMFILVFFATPILGSILANARRSILLNVKTELAKPILIIDNELEQEWSVTFYANYELYTCKVSAGEYTLSDKPYVKVAYYPNDPRLCELIK